MSLEKIINDAWENKDQINQNSDKSLKDTINKMFTGLESRHYYEIGKMCMTDDMPRNSESQMLSDTIKWLKKTYPNLLFLYTMADGIMGKCGYVYQASNFLFGEKYFTQVYMMENGEKLHPRSARGLCEENAKFSGKEKVFWLIDPIDGTSNFIHGIVLVGAMVALGRAVTPLEQTIGFIGVFLGAGNAVGGYVVTERMLEMFKRSKDKKS